MAGKRSMRLSSAKLSSGQSKKNNGTSTTSSSATRRQSDDSFGSGNDSQPSEDEMRSTKRQKVTNSRAKKGSNTIYNSLFQNCGIVAPEPCVPSSGRQHSLTYHKPLFLCDSRGLEHRQALLSWFDSVSTTRAMPWRKAWINPSLEPDASKLQKSLERRAYQVWISEIMLQQTRVAVVIDYWNRWMDKWPTIQDLANADPEDVLAAWRGLGYYSRATRIHEAAKIVVQDPTMQGLLPAATPELEAKVPGVGRYTAGAISAIVFGRAAPMVDGNVLRVLSRQLGIHGNIKTDKKVIDAIWAAADALVHAIALDYPAGEDDSSDVSDRPGRWGQALMELGSTVCTPKPNCSQCPVTTSCRVYNEAKTTVQKKDHGVIDIEDACTICEPFEEDIDSDPDLTPLKDSKANTKTTKQKGPKQMTLSAFAFTGKPTNAATESKKKDEAQQEAISNYARKFPLKTVKKPVRQEETVVCAIRHSDGSYLLHRRPEKGLLAGLWEFPSKTLSNEEDYQTAKQRTVLAKAHMGTLFEGEQVPAYVGELGSVPWLFSHLKLTMHVHLFRLGHGEGVGTGNQARWSGDVEGESMGTGMRKCWSLVKDAE